MNETQQTISKWAIETFGKPKTLDKVFNRYMDEVFELEQTFTKCNLASELGDECADVLIVLYQVCQESGIDLQKAVDAKMKINRTRKWDTKGDGVGQHI